VFLTGALGGGVTKIKLVAVLGILLLVLGLLCGCTSSENDEDDEDKPLITIKGFKLEALGTELDENDPDNTVAAVSIRVVYKNLDGGYTLKVKCIHNGSVFNSTEYQDPDINASTGSTIGLLFDVVGEQIPEKFTVSVWYRGKEMDDKEYFPTKVPETFGDI
jgi:hypothetical protein